MAYLLPPVVLLTNASFVAPSVCDNQPSVSATAVAEVHKKR